MSVPDYCEPIIAWRAWNVREADNEKRLVSKVFDIYESIWEPYVALEAKHYPLRPYYDREQRRRETCNDTPPCSLHTDTAPGCGIYAFKNPWSVIAYWKYRAEPIVVGRVALWGRYAEHEHGWRAQYAYPHTIAAADSIAGRGGWVVGPEIADIYGIPYEETPWLTSALRLRAASQSHYIFRSLYQCGNASLTWNHLSNPTNPILFQSTSISKPSHQEIGISMRFIKPLFDDDE